MLLGIAYLRNNNKAEAAKAFRKVKSDPIMARIAAPLGAQHPSPPHAKSKGRV